MGGHRVGPLQYALRTSDIRREPQFECEHSRVECCEVISVLATRHNPQYRLVEAALDWVLDRVVVGAEFEHKEALVICRHVYLHYDVLTGPVLPGDYPVSKSAPGGLMVPRPGVGRVSAYSAPASVTPVLMLEAPAEALVVIEVRGIVITESPHGGPGGRLHQPGVGGHPGGPCQ